MDPWSLLGVKPGDSEADLARAYRRAMFDSHPDRGGDESKAKRLTAAYETLRGLLVDGRLAVAAPTPVNPGAVVHQEGVTVIFRVIDIPYWGHWAPRPTGSW